MPEDSARPWKSASGGIGRERDKATIGALAEAMERYSAAVINFPIKKLSELRGEKTIAHGEFTLFSQEQYNDPNFPWKKPDAADSFYGEVFSLYDNEKIWVPQELIGLGTKSEKAAVPSTSTGLAAHFDTYTALLLAVQELLERDALSVYWLNGLGGREIMLEASYTKPVKEKFGEVVCFDITQAWNPHPIIVVCGHLPQRNKKRISLGAACRRTHAEAVEKAYLEWVQGVIFAGFYDLYHPDMKLNKTAEVVDFDTHAVYYTLHPNLWKDVPLIKYKTPHKIDPVKPKNDGSQTNKEMPENLLASLRKAGVRMFYRDVTAPDVRETGLTVVRALSPGLSLLHGDERAPFLGGRTRDVAWRYPDLKNQIAFPNKYPHPLG